jgi:hypothetical protein
MLLQIAVKAPDAGDPLGVLGASHRRHQSRLRGLTVASTQLLSDDEERRTQALEGFAEALAFFRSASDEPFRDEADVLFPALLAQAPDDAELAQACASLGTDRHEVARRHRTLGTRGQRLLDSSATVQDLEAIAHEVEALEALYRNHLERLEVQIFPRALTLLDKAARAVLADAMVENTRGTVLPEERSLEPVGAALS